MLGAQRHQESGEILTAHLQRFVEVGAHSLPADPVESGHFANCPLCLTQVQGRRASVVAGSTLAASTSRSESRASPPPPAPALLGRDRAFDALQRAWPNSLSASMNPIKTVPSRASTSWKASGCTRTAWHLFQALRELLRTRKRASQHHDQLDAVMPMSAGPEAGPPHDHRGRPRQPVRSRPGGGTVLS